MGYWPVSFRVFIISATVVFNAVVIWIMSTLYPYKSDGYAETETDTDALWQFIDGILSTGPIFAVFIVGNVVLLFLVVGSLTKKN